MKFTEPPLPVLQAAYSAERAHGIPVAALLGVAWNESRYNPKATNAKSGAQGLMQIMPATAKGLGTNPYDPISAMDGAARLLKRWGYQTNPRKALASYVWGPGNVRKKSDRAQWPSPVKLYVDRVMARSAEWRALHGDGEMGAIAAVAAAFGFSLVAAWALVKK